MTPPTWRLEAEPAATPGHGTSGDPDQLADPRVRAILDGYVRLSGATLVQVGIDCFELAIPEGDRPAFGGRAVVRIALSVESLELEPDAEMAVVGSAFVEQLIAAVRTRGSVLSRGDVPASIASTAEATRLSVPVLNGEPGPPTSRVTRHLAGVLRARVSVRAGTSMNEYLTESGLFDLTSGLAFDEDVARVCAAFAPGLRTDRDGSGDGLAQAGVRPMGELVAMMLGDLERRLASEVERQRAEAARALQFELARIDRYYSGMLEDIGGRGTGIPDVGARRAIEAEHARRRAEEIGRHEVRAIVHPVQLMKWTLPVQRAEWTLTSRDGHASSLNAQRVLVGEAGWQIGCPHCGRAPVEMLIVCKDEHTACAGCGSICAVCGTGFCMDHGIAACHVDGQPVCNEHERRCPSCHQLHCTLHESICDDGGHAACSTCVAGCAHCGRAVCNAHAIHTASDAPLGTRRLCAECVSYCEGGSNEPVGVDEVVRCASCERFVCGRHQAVCAVDGKVHCSRHLRRTDASRRIVCEHDRASCVFEPHAIFASDEVTACASCGKIGCSTHTGVCAEDGRRHCVSHLTPLVDRARELGCEVHRSTCHVDGRAYSLMGTRECPICVRRACAAHTRVCPNCARSVCSADLPAGAKAVCRTCMSLSEIPEPSDAVLHAAVALSGDGGMPKRWRQGRDAIHVVVEMDFGWTRRTVFTVRHGESRAATVVRHSLLGRTVEKSGV